MLKNLKSLFFVEDDNNEQTEDKINQNTTKETTANQQEQVPLNSETLTGSTNVYTKSTDGNVDQKIIGKLLQAIEENNLDGFDYFEYKKSLKALEKMPMDEATKYRSAFATAATLGVTLDKLMQSVTFYIGILDKENTNFTSAFKSQLNDKVSGREKEIVQFESIIKEKSEQIKKLTQEISKHQQQITDLRSKIDESNFKINKTQNDFKTSYTYLKSQFDTDKEKMQNYLK